METLLSKIKWEPLDANGFQARHEKIYDWQVKANIAIQALKSDLGKFQELNLLLTELVRKTSAEKTLEAIQKISEFLELPNPAIEFCTLAKLSGTFGIRHIVSITLISFVPRNFINDGYIQTFFWDWDKLYRENRKIWTKRLSDNNLF